VLVPRSTDGSPAWGVLLPQPRWSNRMIRYLSGSKYRRHPACSPTPARRAGRRPLPAGVTALLPVDEVGITHIQESVIVGLSLRVQRHGVERPSVVGEGPAGHSTGCERSSQGVESTTVVRVETLAEDRIRASRSSRSPGVGTLALRM